MPENTSDQLPTITAKRLLYVGTGGVQAMLMPAWLQWIRSNYPDLTLRYIVTRSAMRFTTETSLSITSGQAEGMVDAWPEQPDEALHVELSAWPDAVLVHPATMHFVARFALGLADSPTLLALQCTQAPIVVCPSLPPGGHKNPAYRRHVGALAERPNVAVLAPVSGVSMQTGEAGIGTPAPVPAALAALENLHIRRTANA